MRVSACAAGTSAATALASASVTTRWDSAADTVVSTSRVEHRSPQLEVSNCLFDVSFEPFSDHFSPQSRAAL